MTRDENEALKKRADAWWAELNEDPRALWAYKNASPALGWFACSLEYEKEIRELRQENERYRELMRQAGLRTAPRWLRWLWK